MADLQLLHLVARTTAGARPFLHRRACADLWDRIARNFDVVALVLMPDHVHLLAQIERDIALRAFGRVLSAFRLRMHATTIPELSFEWERIPSPEKVQRDRRHIARTVRYIHLNPTRDSLCGDPLEWEGAHIATGSAPSPAPASTGHAGPERWASDGRRAQAGCTSTCHRTRPCLVPARPQIHSPF